MTSLSSCEILAELEKLGITTAAEFTAYILEYEKYLLYVQPGND